MHKLILSLLLSAVATTLVQAEQPACGPEATRYSVKSRHQKPALAPAAGKALIVLVEDRSAFNYAPEPTTRAALDGQWLGAVHGNVWTAFDAEPGAHQFCASWESWSNQNNVSFGGLHAGWDAASTTLPVSLQAGQVAYFLVKNVYDPHTPGSKPTVTLTLLTASDAQTRLRSTAYTVSMVKPARPVLGGIIKKRY